MEDSKEDCEEENDEVELSRMPYECNICNDISCNLSHLNIHTKSVYVPGSVLCPTSPRLGIQNRNMTTIKRIVTHSSNTVLNMQSARD